MDHEQVQFDLIDHYLMGKLSKEESVSFEEHFVDCPQCIAKLQSTKYFLQDLRFVAAEQPWLIYSRRPRGRFWYSLQTSFRKPIALAVVCLFIASSVGAVFVINYTRRLQAEVHQAKSLSDQWERRYEEERQSALSAERSRQEMELQLNEQRRALEEKLKNEQTQRTKMATEFSRLMRPEGSLPIFILTSKRGHEPGAPEATNRIALPGSAVMFAFSIYLESEMPYKSYRIKILDLRRRLIWKQEGLTLDSYKSLSIGFKPGFFRPGDYSLIVEGLKKDDSVDTVGKYPFTIIKTH